MWSGNSSGVGGIGEYFSWGQRRAGDVDGKTASDYKQLYCLGTYDTLSEIGKRKRELICRGAKVKLRLIVLRTCAWRFQKRERGSWSRAPPPGGGRGKAPFGGFLCRSSRYNKVQFYCRSAGRVRALFLSISDKINLYCILDYVISLITP